MKKICLMTLSVVLCAQLFAQNATTKKNKAYTASVSELIFSWGSVEAKPLNPQAVLRFSTFLHLGQQIHVDFSDHVGFYSGLSLRNVGMINKLNDTVRIKQRVYTLGIPVALKFGNMNGTNMAVGAEAEFAINYKQKVFVNDEKSKSNVWFSDRTNIFLPSAFAEIKFKQGTYLKFKYYLTDFLSEGKQTTNVPNLAYNPTSSQMMYIAIGMSVNNKKMKTYGTPGNKQM
jgi:hypothetical protein